jgi:5'-3' exonuclease
MGIKGLSKIISEASATKTISSYGNKTIGLDSSIFLYRYIYRAHSTEEEIGCILKGFLEQLVTFKKHSITPIYIFDGYDTVHKRVLEDRKKRRDQNTSRIESMKQQIITHRNSIRSLSTMSIPLAEEDTIETDETDANVEEDSGDYISNSPSSETKVKLDTPVCLIFESDSADSDDMDKVRKLTSQISELQSSMKTLEKQNRKPTQEHLQVLKEMLDLLKIPYIHSPGESDLVCSQLAQNKVVDAIFSDDTDMLPLKCDVVVTGFKTNKLNNLKEYKLSNILEHLELTQEQFIDVCILSGCDYAQKIDKIAIKRAYQFIKKYKSIEKVLEYINKHEDLKEKHTYPEDFEEQYQIARSMFLGTHEHINELKEMDVEGMIVNKTEKPENLWKNTSNDVVNRLEEFLEQYNTPDYTKILEKFENPFKTKQKERPKDQPSILSFFKDLNVKTRS